MAIDIFKKPWLKSAAIAAGTGFVLSFLLVLIFGGGFPALIWKPFLSAILLSTVWISVYILLQKFVPDIISQLNFSNDPVPSESEKVDDVEDFNFDLNEDKITESKSLEESGPEAGEQPFSEDIKITGPAEDGGTEKKIKKNAGSDEMMVEGIPLKKDPDLMARAIQHVLDSEDD